MFVLVLHHSVWGGTPHISSAPTQGHPSPGRSALSLLRCGEHPRGYPDVASGGYSYPALQLGASRGGAVFVLILHHSVWGGTPHISSAPTQGHPSPGRSALSSLRIGERPCDTLRAHPENTARHLG